MAHNFNVIQPITLFDNVSLASSASSLSPIVKMGDLRAIGFQSLHHTVTGPGTIKFDVLLSNDGNSPIDVTNGEIKTGISAASGADVISFTPAVAVDMRIRMTETSDNAVSATVVAAVQ